MILVENLQICTFQTINFYNRIYIFFETGINYFYYHLFTIEILEIFLFLFSFDFFEPVVLNLQNLTIF